MKQARNIQTKPLKPSRIKSDTEILRNDIKVSSIPLTKISKHSRINYRRLYGIINYGIDPSYDEGLRLKASLAELVSEKANAIKTLEQRYATQ